MNMTGEVIADVLSGVFFTIHYFECVPVELVVSLSLKVFVLVDPNDQANIWLELHTYITSPIFLGIPDPLVVSWHLCTI